MGSDDGDDYKYVDRNTGMKYRFKLVWYENDKCGIALGNDYHLTTSGVLVFNGCEGDITISPTMKYLIK